MITYDKLKRKPRAFRSITGMSITEFDELYQRLIPAWARSERERLSRPDRQRAVGGGHPYSLGLKERLLMTAVWLRLYLSTEALGFFFDVDKSTASRNARRLLPCLRLLGDETLGWPEPPQRGEGRSIEQALRDYPDLLALIDATEQTVERPSDNTQQKVHYSGKKKRHTRKTQIIVNEKGVIRDVSASTPGSVHDLKHFRQSGAAQRIPKEVTAGGDAGYQGLHKELPDHSVFVPHKARRNHPLTQDEKLANRELSGERIVVENTLSELKRFKALVDTFRHAVDIYDDVVRSVVAIVNPRITRRVALASVS
jgi:IS5 family transposase